MQRATMHAAKQAPGAPLQAAGARRGAQQQQCDCAGPKAVFGDCAACAGERRARLQRHGAERVVSAAPAGPAADVQTQINSRVGQGAALPAATRDVMESAFGTRLGGVRIHADAAAAAMNRTLRAQAFTFGRDIFFNAGRFDPGSTTGQHLLAHELTHVVQQGREGRPAVQLRSELEDFPEAERRQVRVLRSIPGAEAQKTIDTLYTTPDQFGAWTLPEGLTLQFGTSVAEFRRKGLTLVAGSLVTAPDQTTPAFLPKNSAIDLAIPAAKAVFRFTRLDRPSSAKAGAFGPVPEVVLVEEIGVIPPEPKPMWEMFPGPFSEAQGPLPQPEAKRMRECLAEGADIDVCRRIILGVRAPGEPEPAPIIMNEGKVVIREVKLTRGPGWNEDDWGTVSAALESLPDVTLKQAAGIKLLRADKKACAPDEVTAGTCDPNRAAETDVVAKTITLFDRAFLQSTIRFGMATELQFALIHEIGHVADYVPLGAAFASFKVSKDENKMLAARSRSGSAFVKQVVKGKTIYQRTQVGGTVAKGSFREAAIQDGLQVTDNNRTITGGGVTTYGETGWEELFPESFALYNTDPDLLKAIRPNIFAYFERVYPKQPAP